MKYLTVLLVLLGTVPIAARSAAAQDAPCPSGTVSTPVVGGPGTICVAVTDTGGSENESPGTSNTVGVAVCSLNGEQIPCVTDLGVWFSSHQCYAQAMQPQPSAESPSWHGHTPADGQVWVCTSYGGPVTNGEWFFVANGETPTLVNAAELAANAVGQLPLAVPVVHLAPGDPAMTYVGLETWLWMDPGQWQDLSLTVTAGGTSVSVLARPVRARWDLTEGEVECASAGTPWTAGMSAAAQTDCSYFFERTSASRGEVETPVSATLTYDVSWTCSGACTTTGGSLGEVDGLPGSSTVRVSERQSVVINDEKR